MNIEKIENRIVELQALAKQHEAILLQISGAIQELTSLVSQEKGKSDVEEISNAESV